MPEFTAKDVQALRQSTGVGMMDAKRALQESAGDMEAAARWLREQGKGDAGKRAGRANQQGAVAVAVDDGAGAIVELKSESDYVAKSPQFTDLAAELAEAVLAKGEQAAAERQDDVDHLTATMKENIAVGRVVRFEAAEGGVIDAYLHIQNDRGVNGVLVELVGGDRSLAHEVALHVASMRPEWISRDEVPADRVAAERQVLETLTRNEGKPEQAVPKIVEGRLAAFFRDRCLLEQPFVKDTKRTVRQLLGAAVVTRFAQLEIGR